MAIERLGSEIEWLFQHFSDQCRNWRALGASQGDVREKWVPLEGFHNSDDSIMTANPQVISLGNVVSENNARTLTNSRENRE